jgi:hypothetical protein
VRASRGLVDQWIAVLSDVDESDLETLDFLVSQIPDELFWEINEAGGPPIIHKVYAPILASLEREGLIEWSGEYRGGRKVWRATSVGSDKT